MIPVPSGRVILTVGVLATASATPSRAAEKLLAHPKSVYRQIGAGWTLALDAARREKTFFVCAPSIPSAKALGYFQSVAASGLSGERRLDNICGNI